MNIIFVDISSWISIRTFFTSDTTCPRRHWSRESRFFKILFFFIFSSSNFGLASGRATVDLENPPIQSRPEPSVRVTLPLGKWTETDGDPIYSENRNHFEFVKKNLYWRTSIYLRIYPRMYFIKWPGINGPLVWANIIVHKNLSKGSFNPDDSSRSPVHGNLNVHRLGRPGE